MNIGVKIKEIRTKKNISQIELAKLLNITQPALAVIESDKRTPRIETLSRIATALNVDFLSLLPNELTKGAVIPSDSKEAEIYHFVSGFNDRGKQKVLDYVIDLSCNPQNIK